MITETYIDALGNEFKVGDRVVDGQGLGTVISVSDPDGDVDDEGRSIYISPKATVRFDNGDEEVYSSFWTATGPHDEDAPWQFDDFEKASA